VSTADIVGIVIAVVVVLALVLGAARIMAARRALRERFGSEYDNVVREKGGRAAAEAELRRRTRAHARLELHDIPEADRARFREMWDGTQARFVDDPAAAVRDADRLIAEIVAERGYPVVEFGDRVAHLSVEHTAVLDDYRAGHAIAVRNDAGRASTEELRQALVHYRAVFADVIGDRAVATPETSLVVPVGEGGDVAALAPDRDASIDAPTTTDRDVVTAPEAELVTAPDVDGVPAPGGDEAAESDVSVRPHDPDMHQADDGGADADVVAARDELDTDERVNGAVPTDDPAATTPRRRR
jgi:hypothetical protein